MTLQFDGVLNKEQKRPLALQVTKQIQNNSFVTDTSPDQV